MQLEQLSAELRPRNAWEAMDLGIQMARKRFLKLWGLWWLSALPVTLIATLLLYRRPELISTTVWWFKPLFEPALLFWLSRALFNEDPTFRQIGAHWWPVTRRRLLGNLTWRRFSTHRSLFMPIAQLEQPDRAGWRKRTRLFTRRFSGGTWLTVAGVHFEAVLTTGMVLGAILLIPQQLLPDWEFMDWLRNDNQPMAWAWNLASLLSMSLIAPFYVAGGFAQYLSRRTELEAWDIELGFRRWLAQLPRHAAAALALVAVCGLVAPPAAEAASRAEVARAIDQVLADDDFGSQKTITRWTLKTDKRTGGADSPFRIEIEALALWLEVMAWIAAALLAAWLGVQLYRHRHRWRRRGGQPADGGTERRPAEQEITSLPAALPEDIPAAVRHRLDRGDTRGAVALLYRASLQVLARRFALAISESSTEYECLAAARQARPPREGDFFAELTRQWIGVAYAGLQPEGAQVLRLLDDWRRLYGGASAMAAGGTDA